MTPQDPNTPVPEMTDADMRLAQAERHNQSTEGLLETMIQQGETNNPVPVLEHILVKADETKQAIEKSAIPAATVEKFMEKFVETVEQLKGEPGADAVVDYEKVVAEAVPKVEEAIKGDATLMDSFKAKPEDVAKELTKDQSFIESLKAEEVDPAEVAHTLRNSPFFIEQLRAIPELKGEPGDPGTSETVDYAKIVSLLKGDVDFVALTKGEPGAIVRGKTTGAKELMDYISSRTGDDRLSYNSLKDTPNFDLYRPAGGGAGYLRELSDVDLSGLTIDQSIKWNGTRWVVYTPGSGGGGSWGSITGTLSAQTDLQAALDAKVTANVAITGATKTKVTYDAKGLVTSGADATTADIADSANRRYVTDAQLVVIGNTSGTNTGDQTSIVGITGTKAQFNTAVTDGNIMYVGDSITGATATAWRVFYSDGSGVITELALGADGTFLKSNGAAVAPSFATPAGSGDVSKVGTPANNQVGVWTGDGTIEGDADLTFDTTTNTLATGIVTVTDDAYAAGWNGSTAVPTKNAVYDKIESMGGGVTEAFVIAMATAL